MQGHSTGGALVKSRHQVSLVLLLVCEVTIRLCTPGLRRRATIRGKCSVKKVCVWYIVRPRANLNQFFTFSTFYAASECDTRKSECDTRKSECDTRKSECDTRKSECDTGKL